MGSLPHTTPDVNCKRQARGEGTHAPSECVWPVISWSAGCRYWTKTELGMLRALQVCLMRRILQRWPCEAETWASYWRRSTSECEQAWGTAGVHHWQMAAAAWWWG